MFKFEIGMKVELFFSEEMNTELDFKELLKNGDIEIGEIQSYIVDEDGDNILDEEGSNKIIKAIMEGLKGAGAE
jgi:hypothetical protein